MTSDPVIDAEVAPIIPSGETIPVVSVDETPAATNVEPPSPTKVATGEPLDVMVDRIYKTRGQPAAAAMYSSTARRFTSFYVGKGWDLKSLPGDAVSQFIDTLPTEGSKRFTISTLRACFNTARAEGIAVSEQAYPKIARKPKPPKVKSMNGTVIPIIPPTDNAIPTTPAPSAASLFSDQLIQTTVTSPVGVAKPTARARPTTSLPAMDGRLRISKRADGTEGAGVPVGSLILVGDYMLNDIETEGSVVNFINGFIVPAYGPRPGGRNAIYIVDRLDSQGRAVPGQTQQIPVLAPGTGGVDPRVNTTTTPPPAEPSPAIAELRRRDDEITAMQAKIMEKLDAKPNGGDETALRVMFDQLRAMGDDVRRSVAAAKEPTAPPRDTGSFGGFAFPTPAPIAIPAAPPPADETAMKSMLDTLNRLVDRLAAPQLPPPPIAPAPPDPLEQMSKILAIVKALTPAPPTESEESKILRTAMLRRFTEQEKPVDNVSQVLNTMKALNEFKDSLNPSGGPPTLMEVLAGAVENADKIGDAFSKVIASLPNRPPKVAPRQLPAAASPAPGAQAPQQQQQHDLPKDAQAAILSMVRAPANDDQAIMDATWALIIALRGATDPFWHELLTRLITAIQRVDSKPEIRALVTNLLIQCGAKRLADEATIEKVTGVIHANYSAIFKQLTGQEKTLADAAGAPPEQPNGAQANGVPANGVTTAPVIPITQAPTPEPEPEPTDDEDDIDVDDLDAGEEEKEDA